MPTRRSLLASMGGLSTATLAGCSTPTSTPRHTIDMYNGSDERHVFAVSVTNEGDETIFEEEFDLGPNTADENLVIEGTPATISVTIDDRAPVTFSWDPQAGAGDHSGECQEGTSTSVRLWYDQQDGEGLKQTYGCETAQKP